MAAATTTTTTMAAIATIAVVTMLLILPMMIAAAAALVVVVMLVMVTGTCMDIAYLFDCFFQMGFGLFIIFTVRADRDHTDSWTRGVGYDNGLAMIPSTTC